jgi:CelD/BcsL family acetyltransferase involved in cellulose biosynthesis
MLTCSSPELVEDLEALRPQWDRLWREDPQATPFQSPQWLLPWWKHLGQGRLRTLTLRDEDGRLVGLAPLYLHTDAAGRRHLFPIGIGTTDYLGLLARPGKQREVAAAAWERVAGWDEWDVFVFPQLRRGAALLELAPDVVQGEPNPVLDLSAGTASIPKATRANLRTCRNRAARVGTIVARCAQAGEIAHYLDALARLHTRRWQERGLPGVLADQAVCAAHAEAAPQLHAAGLLRLHGLWLDDELVAVLYALFDSVPSHERRCCYYLSGFDPRHAFFSPGSLLLAHAIEQAAAEGATAFDFLRGAEPYKYRWGAVDRPMFTVSVPHRAAHLTSANAHPA